MNSKLRRLIVQLLFSLAALADLHAQSYQGGVRGVVTDPQAAVVRNVQVSLTDEATHLSRTAVTDSIGQYVFTALEPATYTVSLAAPGFERLVKKSVVVGAQQFLTLDFQLKVGSSTERVEVTAGTAQLNVADASNGQLINQQKLDNLPAVNRNPYVFDSITMWSTRVRSWETPNSPIRAALQMSRLQVGRRTLTTIGRWRPDYQSEQCIGIYSSIEAVQEINPTPRSSAPERSGAPSTISCAARTRQLRTANPRSSISRSLRRAQPVEFSAHASGADDTF